MTDHATVLQDHAAGRLSTEDAVRALMALGPPPPPEELDVKILRAVDHAWEEIAQDLADGTHPPDTGDFVALHNQVDANQYLINAAEAEDIPWGADEDQDHGFGAMNEIADRLDGMLKARVSHVCTRCQTQHLPQCEEE